MPILRCQKLVVIDARVQVGVAFELLRFRESKGTDQIAFVSASKCVEIVDFAYLHLYV